MSNKCKHQFGEVDNKGYQYCILCGKAKLVGIPKCQHNWRIINTLVSENIYTKAIVHYIYVQQCSKCGELNKFQT